MSALGDEIVRVAGSLITPEDICYETSNNRGNCVDTLKCYYKTGSEAPCALTDGDNEAYCAITAWDIVDLACSNLGIQNYLPKTEGAKDMLDKSISQGEIPVDSTPGVGSVFYRTSTAEGASGHIGTVVELDSDTFSTIEGNTNFTYNGVNYQGVWSHYYNYSDIPNYSMKFIHTEDMADNQVLDEPSILGPIIILGLAGLILWHFIK